MSRPRMETRQVAVCPSIDRDEDRPDGLPVHLARTPSPAGYLFTWCGCWAEDRGPDAAGSNPHDCTGNPEDVTCPGCRRIMAYERDRLATWRAGGAPLNH